MRNRARVIPVILVLISLGTLSCGGITSLFATPTPTPTLTPTSTPTPPPTSTPTVTPTPLPTGVDTEKRPDGTTLLVDHDNQFQLILGKEWVILPATKEDFAESLDTLSAQNPNFADFSKQLEQLPPEALRGFALLADRKYSGKGFATNLNVIVTGDKATALLPLDFVMGLFEDEMRRNNARILGSGSAVSQNAHGVEIGTLELVLPVRTATGSQLSVYEKVMVFKSGDKLIQFTVATLQEFTAQIAPSIAAILDSIQPLAP